MKRVWLLSALGFLVPVVALTGVGVGVGTGKIVVNQPFNPGSTYNLPGIPVLNTGDQPAEYRMSVEYQMNQPETMPDRGWFSFEPASFPLEPGSSKLVVTTISLPVRVPPGDYFAYVQAQPIQEKVPGQARIGVAAAAKIYFTVKPANAFQGMYYAALSLYARNTAWLLPLVIVLLAGFLVGFARRFFRFNVSIRK